MGKRGFENKFDIDFKDGLIAEKQLMHLIGACKIEVKNDFFVDRTGNIAIEYECRGKPSGISVTESDWYAIFLGNTNAEVCVFIKVSALKELAKTFYVKNGAKNGGDDNAAKFILVPWAEIIRLSNYGEKQKCWKEHRKKQVG